MSRSPHSLPRCGRLPKRGSEQKATADMEITKQQMDLIASSLTRFAWQHFLTLQLP
jgi:hypothetical protein